MFNCSFKDFQKNQEFFLIIAGSLKVSEALKLGVLSTKVA